MALNKKKAYNFFIFWPTYHKRLATPGVQCIICTAHYTAGVANLWPAGKMWPFPKK